MPGMKKSDLRRHLRTPEQFEMFKTEAWKSIDAYIREIEEACKKKGKVASAQQAKVVAKLESYIVEICDLGQTKVGGGNM
jgi:hypothetical protein